MRGESHNGGPPRRGCPVLTLSLVDASFRPITLKNSKLTAFGLSEGVFTP